MNDFFEFVKTNFDMFNTRVVSDITRSISCEVSIDKHKNVIPYSISYLSPVLQRQINQNIYLKKKYVVHLLQQTITLTIFSYSAKFLQDNNILFVVLFTLFFCMQVKSTNITPNLNLRVVLSRYKKQLRQGYPLDEYNVNSGVTSIKGNDQDVDILVFRREEVAKVLIHEILHAMNMDSRQLTTYDPISSYFGSRVSLNISESFTETYATLLNLALATLVTGRNLQHFKQQVQKEKRFLHHQANKVLQHLGFTITNGSLLPKPDYSETTNIISYFIIKSVNFQNIEEFCSFLRDNRYKLSELSEYILFLENVLKHYKWSKLHNKAEDSTTLRMSSTDLIDILGGTNKAYKTFYR